MLACCDGRLMGMQGSEDSVQDSDGDVHHGGSGDGDGLEERG